MLGLCNTWGANLEYVHLSVGKTIKKLMQLLELDGSDVRKVPIDPNFSVSLTECPTAEEIEANPRFFKKRTKLYQKILGICIWINNVCRPDISFALNVLTRQMHNPSEKHMELVVELAKYLACTQDLGILFHRAGNKQLLTYCDSNKGSAEYHKATCGHIVFLANGPIYWKCSNPDAYPLSTCEAELRAIAELEPSVISVGPALESTIYVKHIIDEALAELPSTDIDTTDIACFTSAPFDFITEENLLEKHEPLTKAERESLLILEDNKAAVEWANKPGAGSKMKHLETRLHWIKPRRIPPFDL